jgi:hypothetical protein
MAVATAERLELDGLSDDMSGQLSLKLEDTVQRQYTVDNSSIDFLLLAQKFSVNGSAYVLMFDLIEARSIFGSQFVALDEGFNTCLREARIAVVDEVLPFSCMGCDDLIMPSA